jgi:hypothetical protein
VPLKGGKISEKGHKRQAIKNFGNTTSDAFARPTTQNLSSENTYFTEKPKTAVPNKRRIAMTSLIKNSVEGLIETVSVEAGHPLNRFNAAHEVTLRPISIYDSLRKTHLNFPGQVDPTLSVSSTIGDHIIPATKKELVDTAIVK